jgi:hypothetical protein
MKVGMASVAGLLLLMGVFWYQSVEHEVLYSGFSGEIHGSRSYDGISFSVVKEGDHLVRVCDKRRNGQAAWVGYKVNGNFHEFKDRNGASEGCTNKRHSGNIAWHQTRVGAFAGFRSGHPGLVVSALELIGYQPELLGD